MRIGVTANPHKPQALRLARAAAERLRPQAEVVFSHETGKALGEGTGSPPLDQMAADLVVAIGGDGTFLWTLQRIGAPLLPINAGTLGFLAEVDGSEPAAFEGALDRLVRGQYYIDARMKLAAQVGGRNLPDATNEVVLHTSQVAKMRLFEIAIDGRPVGRIRADGMILSTPTGSTSYSLSAAGPIVEPGVEGIVVASLASFPAGPRAVIVDPLRTVGLRLVEPGKDGIVVVDGQAEHPIPGGEAVTVYRAPRRAQFIRFSGSFFHRLGGAGSSPGAMSRPAPTRGVVPIFRPQRRSPPGPAPRLGSTPTAITRRCLDSALACAKSAFPNEFGGILRSDPPGTISELLLLPGTTSGRRHANFQLYMLPVDLGVAGTVHSHPSGALHPSEADVRLFSHWGRRHVILGAPFGPGSWRVYDSNGRETTIEVVGGPRGGVAGTYRPPRVVHRPGPEGGTLPSDEP